MGSVVYLVRHGTAAAFSTSGDPGRALTEEGRARFARLAAALAGELRVRRILTSPYARALETAQLLSEAVGAPVEEVRELASGASSGAELLGLARAAGGGCALVGHNPELSEAVHLAAREPSRVVPGAITAVELLDEGGARLLWQREP